MTLCLGDWVECGEIFNTRRYSVHGWIQLRGREEPIVLELTGNCGADLAGWHFRFQAGDCETRGAAAPLPAMACEQIGPTGTMTAAQQVAAGVGPAAAGKRTFYLEWFSQDGRVVVELAEPVLEFVEFVQLPDTWTVEPPAADVGPAVECPDDADAEMAIEAEEEEPCCGDCFSLLPKELEQQFESQAAETDRALAWSDADLEMPDEEKPELVREMELMDKLIERGEGEFISGLFERPLRLPRPDGLGNAQIEESLKSLLAAMARFNIALDVCEHFTPRDAYRLLLEQICPHERAYPELRNTQWIQHFTTAEFCDRCEAESARELEEFDRRRGESPTDEPTSDDDLPF